MDSDNLDELRIALDPTQPGHILPPAPVVSTRILDVGCGAGQTLIAAFPGQVTYGMDPDMEGLRLGSTLSSNLRLAQAWAEQLPYRTGAFGMVTARVSLPYTDLRRSLAEIHRVLQPGGQFWATMHPFSIPWQQMLVSNYRGKLLFAYVAVNSVLFHLFRRQIRLFGKCESFQTERGMRKALASAGFKNIRIARGQHFLVTAERD